MRSALIVVAGNALEPAVSSLCELVTRAKYDARGDLTADPHQPNAHTRIAYEVPGNPELHRIESPQTASPSMNDPRGPTPPGARLPCTPWFVGSLVSYTPLARASTAMIE